MTLNKLLQPTEALKHFVTGPEPVAELNCYVIQASLFLVVLLSVSTAMGNEAFPMQPSKISVSPSKELTPGSHLYEIDFEVSIERAENGEDLDNTVQKISFTNDGIVVELQDEILQNIVNPLPNGVGAGNFEGVISLWIRYGDLAICDNQTKASERSIMTIRFYPTYSEDENKPYNVSYHNHTACEKNET